MKEILFDNKKYKLISSYAEMNRKTFLKISFLRAQALKEIPESKFHALRIQAFYVLSSLPLRKIKNGIDNQQWADLLPHVDFVFNDAPNLDKNLIPVLKSSRFSFQKYYGPIGLMSNASLVEFCEADTAFMEASNLQNQEKLYLLAAILYRPIRKDLAEFIKSPKWNGDIREPYNQEKAIQRSKKFRKLPLYKLVAIFIYYWSFREKELLNGPGLQILFKENNNSVEGLSLGWLGTMYSTSNKEFGDFESTSYTNWKLVIYSIANNLTYKENLEQKQRDEALFNKLKNR